MAITGPMSKSTSSGSLAGPMQGNSTFAPKAVKTPVHTTAIKTVQAPQGGFKLGDIISNIEQGVENIFKPKKTTPLKLSNGLKVNLIDSTSQQSAQLTQTKQSLQQAQKTVDTNTKITKTVQNVFPQTTKDFTSIGIDPINLKANPKKVLIDAYEAIKQSVVQEQDKINKFIMADSTPKKIGAGLESVAGSVNVVFSPLSAFFAAANDIPVLGKVAKIVTIPFTFAGEGATLASNTIIDRLPLSKEVKEAIKPGIAEIAALVAQFKLGHALEPSERGQLIEKYGVKDAITIETKAKEAAKQQEPLVSDTTYKPQEVIDNIVNSGLQDTPDGKKMMKTAIEAQKQGQAMRVESKPSGVSKQIEAKAIEKGMIDKGYTELAQYDSSTIKKQAEIGSKYTIDEINKIATGEQPLPSEMKPGTALSIAEDYAIKNNDVELLRKLAKSPLATQISESASELSLSRMRDNNSPVKIISDVIKSKEEALKKSGKTLEKEASDIKKQVKTKVKVPDRYDWESFVKSIQC